MRTCISRCALALGGAALLSLVAPPTLPGDSGAAIGGGAAGVVVAGGPRANAKSYYYFTGYRDTNGDGVIDPEVDSMDEFRLDVTSHSWWTRSSLATGLIDREALSSMMILDSDEDFEWAVGAEEARSAAPLHFELGDTVPVIIYSSNPDEVLAALVQVTQGVRERRNLVNALGLLQGIEAADKELEKLEEKEGAAKVELSAQLSAKQKALETVKKSLTYAEDDSNVTLTLTADGPLDKLLGEYPTPTAAGVKTQAATTAKTARASAATTLRSAQNAVATAGGSATDDQKQAVKDAEATLATKEAELKAAESEAKTQELTDKEAAETAAKKIEEHYDEMLRQLLIACGESETKVKGLSGDELVKLAEEANEGGE